ncbi:helix-turn-helix domain-containing protein [Tyzzerella nexilis]|nr:helix-turn-helix domain-containing protein [[Clostridium] nexile]MCB7556559.1 helix-turn-helix domain-containing protein [[Clostridium] nexile]MCC3674682.1 helix-turn-helix domain-containing protein [[Clostridium] nexile]NSD84949.1 MerR family transcriptional regulator [[Clostridium] nexile]NSD87304.1 MerR family transcriptional regulator [[Clostridium] nexile]
MGEVHYMISEAAKRVNVETHVLRYWEEELSLSIGRTEMGHRYYTEDDIQLFCCIKELKEQGIQLKELKGLIPDMLRTRDKLKLQKEPKEEPTVSNSVSEEQLDMASNASLEKIQLQIEEIFQHAMLENNKILEESVSQSISQAIIKEMNYLFQAQDRQDEDRYKKLDHLIRQQQTYRKESARSAPIRKLRKLFEM